MTNFIEPKIQKFINPVLNNNLLYVQSWERMNKEAGLNPLGQI